MYWIEKLHHAEAELAERDADPFRKPVEKITACIGDYVVSCRVATVTP
jgi:hypothetical protein